MNRRKLTCITDPLTVNTQPDTTPFDRVMFFVMLLPQRLTVDAFWFVSCGKPEQCHSNFLTCLKCLSHLILEPSEKCSPRWKDEAIQNGNIYPPSRHRFSSSLSVRVSFVMVKALFTKNEELLLIFDLQCACKKWLWMTWLILFSFNTSKCQESPF